MALFKVKVSKKIDTRIRLEESTAKMLDRYAHFHESPADEVVNEALEYIFSKDKDFQKQLSEQPDIEVPATLRVQLPGAVEPAPKPTRNAKAATK